MLSAHGSELAASSATHATATHRTSAHVVAMLVHVAML